MINNADNSTDKQQPSVNIVSSESLPHSEVSNDVNDERNALDETKEYEKIEKETELPSSSAEIPTHDQELPHLDKEISNEIYISTNEDKQNDQQFSDKNIFTHCQNLIENDNEIEDLLKEDKNELTLEAELAQFTENLNKKPSTPLSISSDEDIADVIDEINDGSNEAVKYESGKEQN